MPVSTSHVIDVVQMKWLTMRTRQAATMKVQTLLLVWKKTPRARYCAHIHAGCLSCASSKAFMEGQVTSCVLFSTAKRMGFVQEQDSIDSTSTSGSDSEATLAAEEVCDVLHVSPEDHAMSAVQRKQMSTALKEQLEDLKIQDASKHMQLLGLSIG